MKRLAASALAFSLSSAVVAPSAGHAQSDIAGELAATSAWVNQSGSTMTLDFGPGNAVSGVYINKASGTGCQGTPYALAGWTLGNAISFTVAWDNAYENCNSVTGWTGYAYVDGNGAIRIATDWNLATGTSIQAGKDTFMPLNKTENPSLAR